MIKIMLDSASDCLGEKELYELFAPISINFDNEEYLDGVSIDNDTFYAKLEGSSVFPTTAQPSQQYFVDTFSKVKEYGDELIYISVSSGLSGTYQSAFMASKEVDYDKIYIVDSLSVSHAIRILALHAIELRAQGKSGKEIADACEALRHRIKIFAGVDTLEYFKRGGRLSNASAFVGTVANLKPVLTVTPEGKAEIVSKTLGRARAMMAIIDFINQYGVDTSFPAYSMYTCGTDNCASLEDKLIANNLPLTKRLQLGPTIGTHAGPGVYAYVFVAK